MRDADGNAAWGTISTLDLNAVYPISSVFIKTGMGSPFAGQFGTWTLINREAVYVETPTEDGTEMETATTIYYYLRTK